MKYPRLLGYFIYGCIALLWLGSLGIWLWYDHASRFWVLGLAIAPLLVLINHLLLQRYCIDPRALYKRKYRRYKRQYTAILAPLLNQPMWHFRQQSYSIPCYIFISHDTDVATKTLPLMGFHQPALASPLADVESSLQTWKKGNATVIALSVMSDEEEQRCQLSALSQVLIRYRPRQPLNGIMVCHPLDQMINSDSAVIEQFAEQIRHIINSICTQLSQKLPCYSLLSNLASISDIQTLIDTLPNDLRELPMGGQHATNDDSIFSPENFDHHFHQLIASLQSYAIKIASTMRSSQVCTSLLAAPAQLQLISDQLKLFHTRAFSVDALAEHSTLLCFRGFFLFDAGSSVLNTTDLIAQRIAFGYGQNQQFKDDTKKMAYPLFIKRLFNGYILPEAGLASLNKKLNRRFYLLQSAKIIFPVLIFSCILWLVKVNHDYYINLDHQALAALSDYRTHLSRSPYNIDDFSNIVGHLDELRLITKIYASEPPSWIYPWFPHPSIQSDVVESYQQQLKTILVPKLTHYLEDDLFAYLSLDSSFETAKILNIEDDFHRVTPDAIQHIQHYFRTAMVKEGMDDEGFLVRMDRLIEDALYIPHLSLHFDPVLIQLSHLDIGALDLTKIMYNYLLTQSSFSHLVDISGHFTDKFSQFYRFNPSFSGVLIPYLYTPEGFSMLDISPSSALFQKILDNNRVVVGSNPSLSDRMKFSHNLRLYYQNAYVHFWQKYIKNIVPVYTKDNTLFDSMALFTDVDSPLQRMVNMIAYYTDPDKALPKAAKADASVKQKVINSIAQTHLPIQDRGLKDSVLHGLPKKNETADENNSANRLQIQRDMAANIASNFYRYQQIVYVDSKGNSPLMALMQKIKGLQRWFSKNLDETSPGAYDFNQMVLPHAESPFHALINTETQLPMIDIHLQRMVHLAQQQVYDDTVSYLDHVWKTRIYTPFQHNMAIHYPFSSNALSSDVDLTAFSDFFRIKGRIDRFSTSILSHFNISEGVFILPHSKIFAGKIIQLHPRMVAVQDMWKLIQRDMFANSPTAPSMILRLKPKSLSAHAVRFQLHFGGNIITYQHGPKLWQQIQWPDQLEGGDVSYTFTSTAYQKKSQSYHGIWALLRLFDANTKMDGDRPFLSIQSGEQYMSMQLKGQNSSRMLLFTSNFFRHFQLPSHIVFETQ